MPQFGEPVLQAASNGGSLQSNTLIPHVNLEQHSSPSQAQAQAELSDTNAPKSHAPPITGHPTTKLSEKNDTDEATVHVASVVHFASQDDVKIISNNESGTTWKDQVDSALPDDDSKSSELSDCDSDSDHTAESEEFTCFDTTLRTSNRTRTCLSPLPSVVLHSLSKKEQPKKMKTSEVKSQATPAVKKVVPCECCSTNPSKG